MTVAAVVLAAGGGTRFSGDTHKLLAEVDGRPLAAHTIGSAVAAGLDETVVVVGAVDLSDVLGGLAVTMVEVPGWNAGQAITLRAGVAAVEAAGHAAAVVGLGDQFGVAPEAWEAVAAAAETPIATATFGGERRPPVRLDRSIWPLLPVAGDEGARMLMRKRPDVVREIPCAGTPVDVDTAADLEALTSRR